MSASLRAKALFQQGVAEFRAGRESRGMELLAEAVKTDSGTLEAASAAGGFLVSIG